MGKTIRRNRNGKPYLEKDSAGLGYYSGVIEPRGTIKNKPESKLYGKYGKRTIRFAMCYANERDAQSDRQKGYKHVEGKLLRRGLQRESLKLIESELEI